MNTAGVVHLTQGNNQKVVLNGPQEVLEDIETVVRGGKLIIRNKSNSWFDWSENNDDLEIFIIMKEIEGLSVSGSGKINGENIKSPQL